jgi:hypothetical protein
MTVLFLAPFDVRAESPPAAVEFNRDIRPILSDNCFQCHGPDQAQRKADLRLDIEEGALALRDGKHALVAGSFQKSELYRRVTAESDDKRMPPPASGKKLTARQIGLLKAWIEQGAKWQKHWAFIPPRLPNPPAVNDSDWMRNPIDAFVLARLEQEGLAPSPEAQRVTLLRRVTLDLTGLPPTPAEIDGFLADRSPDAYEKAVDRLLGSPRFGERMASRWLDAARYADTSGYQSDGERFMWRWRDWVIEAYNRNLPFDQFTIEQLAGDLLPQPTLDQRIATGFNRNHRGNGEGGIIPEEYAVEYVADRVETTATVWLGLTVMCTRCHDHKFDPLRQKEFYQLFAFFNNVPERGKAIKFGNSPPLIQAPTPAQQQQLRALEKRLDEAEKDWQKTQLELSAARRQWERLLPAEPPISWAPARGLIAHFPLDGSLNDGHDGGRPIQVRDGTAKFAAGKHGLAAEFDGKRFLDAGDIADFGFYDKFSVACWFQLDGEPGGTIISRMADQERGEGYSVHVQKGRVQVDLVKRWLDDAIRVESEARLEPGKWYHLVVTYDGTRAAGGVRMYLDGEPAKLKVLLDDINQSFQTKEPVRIGAGNGPEQRFHGRIAELRMHQSVLTSGESAMLALGDTIQQIALVPEQKRSAAQAIKLEAYFLAKAAPPAIREAHCQLLALRRQREEMIEGFPTTMVMEEMPQPRETHVLLRGQYDRPGDKVAPDVPSCLPALPAQGKRDRLALARWLIDPVNPLTARVAVNRAWQMYFGTGLVKTAEDFGAQGQWPSHPELLDWLAVEFVRTGWDMKALQRTIVTSAAYRQSSKVTPKLLQRDPENRLLARGPRIRLSAEMIRDQALAASGLLVERLGGPSVKPYQPDGLWKDLAGENYVQDHGDKLYRRSLYTFWKRTVAPPSMATFDAPLRETCIVRETRTNTPLQALNLLNDVCFVESARVLAQRVMVEKKTPEERIALAFRLVAARQPRPDERTILLDGLRQHLATYRDKPQAALKLVRTGEYPIDERLEAGELAAYTAMASLILNLDETITKE